MRSWSGPLLPLTYSGRSFFWEVQTLWLLDIYSHDLKQVVTISQSPLLLRANTMPLSSDPTIAVTPPWAYRLSSSQSFPPALAGVRRTQEGRRGAGLLTHQVRAPCGVRDKGGSRHSPTPITRWVLWPPRIHPEKRQAVGCQSGEGQHHRSSLPSHCPPLPHCPLKEESKANVQMQFVKLTPSPRSQFQSYDLNPYVKSAGPLAWLQGARPLVRETAGYGTRCCFSKTRKQRIKCPHLAVSPFCLGNLAFLVLVGSPTLLS